MKGGALLPVDNSPVFCIGPDTISDMRISVSVNRKERKKLEMKCIFFTGETITEETGGTNWRNKTYNFKSL